MRNANESAPARTARRVGDEDGREDGRKRAPARKMPPRRRRLRVRGWSRVAAAEGGDLAARAAQNTLTANPLIGIRAADLQLAARALLKGATKQPTLFMRHFAEYAGALGDVVRGKSTVAPDPKDKRFADPAWQTSFLHRRLMQVYTRERPGHRQVHHRDRPERARQGAGALPGLADRRRHGAEQHDPRQPDGAEEDRRHRRR